MGCQLRGSFEKQACRLPLGVAEESAHESLVESWRPTQLPAGTAAWGVGALHLSSSSSGELLLGFLFSEPQNSSIVSWAPDWLHVAIQIVWKWGQSGDSYRKVLVAMGLMGSTCL